MVLNNSRGAMYQQFPGAGVSESPESPPLFDQTNYFSREATKIRVETEDASLRFSIDRVGHLNQTNATEGSGLGDFRGGFSGQPSPGSSNPFRGGGGGYRMQSQDIDYRSHGQQARNTVGYSTGSSSTDTDYRRTQFGQGNDYRGTYRDIDFRPRDPKPIYNTVSRKLTYI